MKYKTFGKTGKSLSVIGFGGMRFNHEKEDEAVETVKKAFELGINYFDTAPFYCNDRSEDIIGKAVSGFKNKVYLSTKSSVGNDPTADDMRKRLETSLKRLGVDRISFYNMWCIMDMEHFSKVMAPGGPYEGAVKAKEEGLIEHICFSAHANGVEIEEMVKTGFFEGVTLGYNILNSSNRLSGIRAAHREGLGVVTMNPLGGGMIPAGAERFSFLKESENDSVVKAALRFNLSHPEINVVLAGMASLQNVVENASVADEDIAPDNDKVRRFIDLYGEMGEHFCTSCKYCMPCPEDINIPMMMMVYDWMHLNDPERSRMLYNFAMKGKMKGLPSSCTQCGSCESKCTQHLPVIERMASVAEKIEKSN